MSLDIRVTLILMYKWRKESSFRILDRVSEMAEIINEGKKKGTLMYFFNLTLDFLWLYF